MTTISRTVDAPTDSWTRVDQGYAAISMKRRLVYPMMYFIGSAPPAADDADGVHTWNGGAVTIRDLAGSRVYVKAKDTGNQVELVLGSAAVSLESSTANFVDLTLSLDTSIYADGDVLAATQEVAGATPSVGAATALHSIVVLDKDDVGQGLDLIFLSANVPVGAENAPLAISDADAAHVMGVVSVSPDDFMDMGGCRVATLRSIGLAMRPAEASNSIFVAAISRGAGTYSAAGINLRLGFI